MKSHINEDFLRSYRQLPKPIRQQARKAYQLFRDNPQHPSLNFKRVHTNEPIYSARITRSYRTIGIVDDDVIIWFWIGSHSDYDALLKNR